MMKKSIVICVLILSLLATNLVAWAQDASAVFTINTPQEMPKAGETFEVTVSISNNPGFCAIDYNLSYDSSEMECVSMDVGEVLETALSATNVNADGGPAVSAATVKPAKKDGVTSQYVFKAKTNIDSFNFALNNTSLVNENLEKIPFTIKGAGTPSTGGGSGGGGGGGSPSQPEKPKDDTKVDEEEATDTPTDEETEAPTDTTVEEKRFTDVSGHWGESFINEAAKLGLFNGNADGTFRPDDNVTRVQFVTVLWRMEGSPAVDVEIPFTDIENQIPDFKAAIKWAYANGYVDGVSPTRFNPGGTLTREAGMKILHFFSGGKTGGEAMLTAIYDGTFKDSGSISDWAKKSVYWGVYNKLISGTSETTLSPKGTATRAQLAKILINYISSFKTN